MDKSLCQLKEMMAQYPRWLVITGAGISAKSGIPTYRDHKGNWQRSRPIQHQEFIEQRSARQRYWSRSLVGWKALGPAAPGDAHFCLSKWEQKGAISLLVTQNVDGLHQRAGSHSVLELHGSIHYVVCLNCGRRDERETVQAQLVADNPRLVDWVEQRVHPSAPDGDAYVEYPYCEEVRCPSCPSCDGILMPDVVFFGGSVPKARVEKVTSALLSSDAVLVVGSSLMVYSGFRFCRLAAEKMLPIAAINKGVTRADELLSCKVEMDCSTALSQLIDA
ncbi:NAD-dependent protein deacetylase [Marinibactrum halimedae]|uniref:protein acetyllysine N-acetyltransferase n=1 Tax=Marinibactrum halimedae TaxID=1444977 RepID=A0AA37WLD3_9GAMM|nr:NAD-dependent protein deacetylase [Marinibactrum halimedae]MCD9460457.1 NAD-dependent protein deacetylase [Marinibactrum halimedae]GLS25864.1 NAD-dependent protein deacetylase [Marinibactrum halimedae]